MNAKKVKLLRKLVRNTDFPTAIYERNLKGTIFLHENSQKYGMNFLKKAVGHLSREHIIKNSNLK